MHRLGREFSYHFRLEPVLWEREPLLASHHFQDLITPPRETDIVVVILWSRLGVPLPAEKYTGPLSGRTVTGTEWEFEDALASFREHQLPELVLYRKSADRLVKLNDRASLDEQVRQTELVEDFMTRWFRGADGLSFSAASWAFADALQFDALLEEHLRALLRKRLTGPTDVEAPATIAWHQGSPYRGLEPFTLDHAPVFFGRTRARNEVRERLTQQIARGCAFVAVVGASGSGKSSLVKAGVLPDLRRPGMIGQVALCRYAITQPGALIDDTSGDPLLALATALFAPGALPELAEAPLLYTPDRLASLLHKAPEDAGLPIRQGLSLAGQQAGLTERGEARVVVIVDQLEELFTAAGIGRAGQDAYVAALGALAASGLVWVIATLRSDFFGRLEQLPALARLCDGPACYVLTPPDATEIGQIIRQPAREAGLRFEVDLRIARGLDEEIREVAARDTASLPLLQYLLDQLWQRRTAEGVLTFAAYRDLKGLEGAIGERAEALLAEQPEPIQAAFPTVLRALVTMDEAGRAATARRIPLSSFAEGSPERLLVEALLRPDARILVADGDPGSAHVRVAHEALLTHWPRALQQIETDARDLRIRARLEAAEARWGEAAEIDRDSLLLPRGQPLSEGEGLLARRQGELAPALLNYITASGRAARKVEQRRLRRLQIVAAVLVILTLGATLGAWFGFTGQRQAEAQAVIARRAAEEAGLHLRQAQINQARAVSGLAFGSLERGDFEQSILLSLEVLPNGLVRNARPLWSGAMSVLLQALNRDLAVATLKGHKGTVNSAVFSPDGTRLLTASADETARIWDARTCSTVAILKGHDGTVFSAAFNRDGTRVVTASGDMTARIWDARTGEIIVILEGHTGIVHSAAFSPDGTRVATASVDSIARIWDANNGAPIVTIGTFGSAQDKARTNSIAFSPDGRRLVTASDDETAQVWDTITGALIMTLKGHENYVISAAFSPDGTRLVTASRDWTGRLWDAHNGALLATLEGHEDDVIFAAFSPDGTQLVTTSRDKTARLWDARNGEAIATLEGHTDTLTAATFRSDGMRLATASSDGTARLWNTRTGANIATLKGQKYTVNAVAFSPDGTRLVTASNDWTARLWDGGGNGYILEGHRAAVRSAAFSADGARLATASGDRTARIWDPRTGALITKLEGHGGAVRAIAYNPDGTRLVTASSDETARLWDAKTGATIAILKGHKGLIDFAAFANDGSRLLTASADATARLWDARDGSAVATLDGHGRAVTAAAFSRDGTRLATGSRDKTVRLWDSRNGELIATLKGHEFDINSVAFSADGTRLVTASSDRTARLWNAATGAPIATLAGHQDAVTSATFHPDGAQLATSSRDKTARLWDARTGILLVVLEGHGGEVSHVTFSPDGTRLATASEDHTARLWDTRNGTALAILEGHDDKITSAAFSPDGTILMTASDDNTARLWKVRAIDADPILYASIATTRELTVQERTSAFLDEIEVRDHPLKRTAGEEGKADLALAQQLEAGGGASPDLEKALFHHIRATRLFELSGDEESAQAARERRGTLARLLPHNDVVRLAREAFASLHPPR